MSVHPPDNSTTCYDCIADDRPNVTEFGTFINWFLHDNPGVQCASGGHAAFAAAVPLYPDNKTVISMLNVRGSFLIH